MSHFVVLVIGDNVEEQLAPFQENNMGDCPEEFLKFHDMEEEYPDSKYLEAYSTMSDEDKSTYSTYELWMEKWHGYKKDETHGKYGYYENPNAKWDWYQIGGRWSGYFKIKPGAKGAKLGSRSLLAKGPDDRVGADVVRKGDIDFDAMVNEAADHAGKEYDEYLEAVKGTAPNKPWSDFVPRMKSAQSKEEMDTIRNEYHNQERLQAIRNAKLWLDADDFLVSRDEYVGKAMKASCVPYAIIKDGNWHARGEMGWWGISKNEVDGNQWMDKAYELLTGLDDDTMITVVDCHI
jgi:hypothetical protein